jgi:hypothetical protein
MKGALQTNFAARPCISKFLRKKQKMGLTFLSLSAKISPVVRQIRQ